MVLLRHQDPWRGLFLASASSSVFSGAPQDSNFAHDRMLEILLDNFASGERLVYGRLGNVESLPLPELRSFSRIFWRAVCVLLFPTLLIAGAVAGHRGFNAIRWSTRAGSVTAWAIAGLGMALLFAWLGGKLDRRLDSTRERINSLAPETKQIVQEATSDNGVEAELIFSREDRLPHEMRSLAKRVREHLAEFQRLGARLVIRESQPEDLDASELAKLTARGIEPVRITARLEEVTTITRFYSTLVFSSRGRSETLRFPDVTSFENLEFRLAFALWRLNFGRRPHIGFAADIPRLTAAEAHENYQVKGLFAPAGTDVYSMARGALEGSEFRVTHINPRKPVIPPGIDLLVWLQPRQPAAPMLETMVRYLHKGGRVLLAAQHFNMQSRQYQGADFGAVYWPQPQWPQLESLYFPEIGIKLVREVLFDELKTELTVESQKHAGGEVQFERMPSALPFLIRAAAANFSKDSPVTRGLGDQAFIWANYLELDESLLQQSAIHATPLIYTSERTWNYAWTGGWIPNELLSGPPLERDGTPRWLGRRPAAVLFEGTFPLPGKSLVESGNPAPNAEERPHGQAPKSDEPGAPGKLLFIACSEVFKNQWIRQPRFRGDHLLLNAVAALALPPNLASIMGRRSVPRGFDYVEPRKRLLWRFVVTGAIPAGFLLILVRSAWRRKSRSSLAKMPVFRSLPVKTAAAGRGLLLLVLVVCALGGLNWVVSYREANQRGKSSDLGRLIPRETRAKIHLAIIKVRSGDGRIHLYGRQQGLWRCLSYRNAPADQSEIESLVRKMVEAEGFVQNTSSTSPEDYGLDTPLTHTISFHGPDFFKDRQNQDVQVWFQIGRSMPGREGSYARLGGSHAIWAIDRNPLNELLQPSGTDLPPMLDRSVAPGVPAIAGPVNLRQIVAAPPAGEPYQLVLRMNSEPKEQPPAARPPWEWIISTSGSSQVCDQTLALSYAAFLVQAPWVEVLNPRMHRSLAFENPRARLKLVSLDGETHELVAGAAEIPGGKAVLNTRFQTAYLVSEEVYQLLFPSARDFQKPGKSNPWGPWLEPQNSSPSQISIPPARKLLRQEK